MCRRILPDADSAEDAFQATFLALLRKADSLALRGSLGSWLYVVAQRIAMRARAGSKRWNALEDGAEVAARVEASDQDWVELCSLLDEELSRLPEKYRLPLVLCCLEGKNHDEAARELGWPRGSMAKRIGRGRELLQQRLTRRGLSVGAVALAASLPRAVLADVPPALATATSKSATATVSGAAGFSTSITVLAEGVIQEMFREKLKLVLLCVFAAAAVGVGIGLIAPNIGGRKNGVNQAEAAPLPERDLQTLLKDFRKVGHVFPDGYAGWGFLSASEKIAYLPKESRDGIDAIDLATGKELWSTREAYMLLQQFGDVLLAIGNGASKEKVCAALHLRRHRQGPLPFRPACILQG